MWNFIHFQKTASHVDTIHLLCCNQGLKDSTEAQALGRKGPKKSRGLKNQGTDPNLVLEMCWPRAKSTPTLPLGLQSPLVWIPWRMAMRERTPREPFLGRNLSRTLAATRSVAGTGGKGRLPPSLLLGLCSSLLLAVNLAKEVKYRGSSIVANRKEVPVLLHSCFCLIVYLFS